jgi:hypothetical protein
MHGGITPQIYIYVTLLQWMGGLAIETTYVTHLQ